MATALEVERLVVRLMGDGTAYQAMLAKAVVTTKAAMGSIVRTTTQAQGAMTGLRGAMSTVGVAAGAIVKGFKIVGGAVQAFGRVIFKYVTLPTLLIGAMSLKAFGSFDLAMVESTSIMSELSKGTEGATQKIAQMRNVARSLAFSGTVKQSATELAKAYYFLASAGKSVAQSMALLPKVAAFATAGNFDLARATDLVTDAQSAMGMTNRGTSIEDIADDTRQLVRVSDVLVKANTLANASVEQFSVSLTSKAGAALKTYGKSIEEGVSVLAAFADQGVKAELAGNSLARILLLLTKAALEFGDAVEYYNVKIFDSVGEMYHLADVIESMEDAFEGMSDMGRGWALMQMGFSARVQGALLPLIGTSKAIREYNEALDLAGGTTERVSKAQLEAFINQLKITWNRISELGIMIGEKLVPSIKWLQTKLEGVVAWWKSLSEETQKSYINTTLLLATIGPLAIALGGLITSIPFLFIGTIVGGLVYGVARLTGMLPKATAEGEAFRDVWLETEKAIEKVEKKFKEIGKKGATADPEILEALSKGEELRKGVRTAQEKFDEDVKHFAEMRKLEAWGPVEGEAAIETFTRLVAKAREELEKTEEQIDKMSGVQAIEVGSKEFLAKIKALRNKAQKEGRAQAIEIGSKEHLTKTKAIGGMVQRIPRGEISRRENLNMAGPDPYRGETFLDKWKSPFSLDKESKEQIPGGWADPYAPPEYREKPKKEEPTGWQEAGIMNVLIRIAENTYFTAQKPSIQIEPVGLKQ